MWKLTFSGSLPGLTADVAGECDLKRAPRRWVLWCTCRTRLLLVCWRSEAPAKLLLCLACYSGAIATA